MNNENILKVIRSQQSNLQMHYKTLEILEGCLEPYIVQSLKRTLSPRVLAYALERLVPINIFPRYVDKLSNIYQTGVTRGMLNGSEQDDAMLSYYVDSFKMNSTMHQANRLFTACKSTLLHPCVHNRTPLLRVIQNDRFVVWSDDEINPLNITGVALLQGRDTEGRDIYWIYTADDFYILRSDGTIDYAGMAAVGIEDGVNPYGVLPFIYINSSALSLYPTPDVDSLKITEYVPTALTDLNLAAMFSTFSMTYITNGQIENPVYAPNALWFLKADDPEKDVQIGTIKPEVSYKDVLDLITSEMSMWLGTKGIKAGAVGNLTPDSASSGIAKIIDEADTFDVRQAQTVVFEQSEKSFWDLILHKIHPVWASENMIDVKALFTPTAKVDVSFSVVPVGTMRAQLIADQKEEYAAGFTTRRRAIAKLNPQLTIAQVDELIAEIDAERYVEEKPTENEVPDASEMAENQD